MSIINQQLGISHHGREIVGTLVEPEGLKTYPLIIFSHGYNGTGEGARRIAEYFAERGIGAFYFDFCGGSSHSKSDLKTTQMTLTSEKEDLLALLQAFHENEKVEKDKIFLFGESQGGMVTCMAAAKERIHVKAIVLLFPALCIADDWNKKFPTVEEIPKEHDFWGMTLGRDFFLDLRKLDVKGILEKIKQNALIMHGEDDPAVPISYSEMAHEMISTSEFIRFPKEGHGFSPTGYQEMMEKTYAFVKKQLR